MMGCPQIMQGVLLVRAWLMVVVRSLRQAGVSRWMGMAVCFWLVW